jgi:hypothetical protein
MKKGCILKILCVFCILTLLSVDFSLVAFAEDGTEIVEVAGEQCATYPGPEVFSDVMLDALTDETDESNENNENNENNEDDDDPLNVDYSAYSILSDHEKQYYDKIVSTPIGETVFRIDYTPYLTKEEFEAIDFRAIMYAVSLDHPEMFWFHGYSHRYKYIKSTGEVVYVEYTLVGPVVSGTSDPVYSPSEYSTLNDELWVEFHRVAEELNLANRTRYSFAKTLHDYLSNSVTYVIDERSCFDPYGTLVNKQAVCQGYAETFKMFCDYYDIPCVNITGTAGGGAHMWNAMQMEDGAWYILDITWDDPDSDKYDIFTDYFLCGLDTVDVNFNKKPFRKSHVSDGSPYLPQLNYASEAHGLIDDKSFNSTYNSYAYEEEQYLALSPFTAPNHEICYNGVIVKDVVFRTGEQFTTYDDKTWTVVIIGDTDGDGLTTVEDYSDSVNRALRDDRIVSTAQDAAADVSRDGVIDALDLFQIQLMHTGCKDDITV